MTLTMFLYKSIKKVWQVFLYNPFCHAVTSIILRGNNVQYKNFSTNGFPIITLDRKKSKISIGKNLRMNNGNANNCIGFSAPCTLTAINGGNIHIGDNVGMSQSALCAIGADIIIGNYTLLGGGVKIYTSDFHSLDYLDRRDYREKDKKNRHNASVMIGNDCFIGAGSIILKGVKIGDRTIIGAGSVVAKSIPKDCIAGGNPCVIIRTIKQ